MPFLDVPRYHLALQATAEGGGIVARLSLWRLHGRLGRKVILSDLPVKESE